MVVLLLMMVVHLLIMEDNKTAVPHRMEVLHKMAVPHRTAELHKMVVPRKTEELHKTVVLLRMMDLSKTADLQMVGLLLLLIMEDPKTEEAIQKLLLLFPWMIIHLNKTETQLLKMKAPNNKKTAQVKTNLMTVELKMMEVLVNNKMTELPMVEIQVLKTEEMIKLLMILLIKLTKKLKENKQRNKKLTRQLRKKKSTPQDIKERKSMKLMLKNGKNSMIDPRDVRRLLKKMVRIHPLKKRRADHQPQLTVVVGKEKNKSHLKPKEKVKKVASKRNKKSL
jgi:hypothetical protein